jgi:hypothetical protein
MATYQETQKKLWEEMKENPDDFLLHLVMADLISDFGDESEQYKAACLRWTAKEKKRPYPPEDDPEDDPYRQWYKIDRDRSSGFDLESDLPNALVDQMIKNGCLLKSGDHVDFPGYQEAMEALFLVWKRCPQE